MVSSDLTLDQSVKTLGTGPEPMRRAVAILDTAVPQPSQLLAAASETPIDFDGLTGVANIGDASILFA